MTDNFRGGGTRDPTFLEIRKTGGGKIKILGGWVGQDASVNERLGM